jgi:methionyl-tRNA formyltransferase
VAFRKLPEQIWNLPRIGTINLHASLLPQYRGAAPINRAIINGEKETGVTTFFISHQIDTGDIILQEKIAVDDADTAGTLHDKLSILGADLLVKTLIALQEGNYPRTAQDFSQQIHKAPKLTKAGCRIDWSMELTQLYNFIRGLSPYPVAWTTLNNKVLKIYAADKIHSEQSSQLGTVTTDFKSYLHVAVKGGYVSITELQIEGKNRLNITEFLKGMQKNQLPVIE